MTLAAAKAAARTAAFARRKAAVSDAAERAANDHLSEVLAGVAGRALAGYLPIRTELDPRPAMRRHLATGPVAVPEVTGPGEALIFRAWHPDAPTAAGAFGVAVPVGTPVVVPEVLIVPLAAFDARGYRLGYGGGFYDRTLAALRRAGPVTAIGLAYAAQAAADLPVEPTDQPLDLIVTETGVRRPALAGSGYEA